MSVQEVSGESRLIVKYVQLDDNYLIYLDGQDFLFYEFLEGCYFFARFFLLQQQHYITYTNCQFYLQF